MSMTPGQIFWEAWESHYGTGARRWNDVDQGVKDRHESCAQAVIAAHVSEQDDLISLLIGLLQEIAKDNVLTASDDWHRKVMNALSRVHANPTPTVDTAKDDVIPLLAGLVREIVTDPVAADERGVMWVNRAHNALSRVQDAPANPIPAVDTPKQVEAPTGLSEAQQAITRECDTVRDMLLDKNRRYGNSALDPVRVFSMADPIEQIRVRIDDKLSRMASRQSDDDEDVTLDLIGYLILLRVAQK